MRREPQGQAVWSNPLLALSDKPKACPCGLKNANIVLNFNKYEFSQLSFL